MLRDSGDTQPLCHKPGKDIPAMTLNIGSDKQLLFDDALTEKKTGFVATIHPAQRAEQPVLVCDQAWEVGGLAGDSNASVFEDGGVLKLYYAVPYPVAAKDKSKRETVSPKDLQALDPKTRADLLAGERQYVLCVATSTDGIHWDKPHAGVLTFRGSKKNNMVFVARMGATVFKDPNAPKRARYKMVYGGGPRLTHIHLTGDVAPQQIYHAIYGAHSPDGLHWTPYPKPIIPWYTDTTNVAYWDDRIGKYVAFVRSNEGMVYQDGKTVTDQGSRLKWRAIGRTQSADFRKFPQPERILEPSPAERAPYGTGLDYYNSAAVKYPFAADSYFIFSSDFYHEPDTLDVRLYTSRDGVRYDRWDEPYLGLGLDRAFDSKSLYMAAGMVRTGGLVRQYYVGYNHRHNDFFTRPPRTGGIGMAAQRLDGFVSQDARKSGGKLLTKPLKFAGTRLQVNMDANSGGKLKVELLDAAGKPIKGFTARDADWLWNNDVARTATWRGETDVSSMAGKPLRLRFIGQNVKLYAFQFVG